MNDSEFINWIADRFVNHYDESEQVDFVQRLRKVANRLSFIDAVNAELRERSSRG